MIHAHQASALKEARSLAAEDGGQVHVMGAPERSDEMGAAGEFVCHMTSPYAAASHGNVAVVYHPETRRVGASFVCAACGELSGDAIGAC